MGEKDLDALTATLLEDACLTLDQLAQAGAVTPAWILRRMEEGVLSAAHPGAPGERDSIEWRFSSRDLLRLRRVRSLEQDFDATPELAALVADLLEEMTELRARLHRASPR